MHYEENDSGDDRDAEDRNGKKVKQWIETGVIGKRLRLLLSHDAGSFARVSPWIISEVDLQRRASVTKRVKNSSDGGLLHGRRFAVQDPDAGNLLENSYNP